jgi:hypothetical protein
MIKMMTSMVAICQRYGFEYFKTRLSRSQVTFGFSPDELRYPHQPPP